jgi:hypothetical protein
MTNPKNYQPPYTIIPTVSNLVAEISEIIGRYSFQARCAMPSEKLFPPTK